MTGSTISSVANGGLSIAASQMPACRVTVGTLTPAADWRIGIPRIHHQAAKLAGRKGGEHGSGPPAGPVARDSEGGRRRG